MPVAYVKLRYQRLLTPTVVTACPELSTAHPDSHNGASLFLIVINVWTKANAKIV